MSETEQPRPRLSLSSAVVFVHQLDRSVAFYQELLGLDVHVRDDTAVLLVSPDGYQLYVRTLGDQAQHPIGSVGVQYVVWTAASEADLDRCERVLRELSLQQVTRRTTDGFCAVQGRDPDGVPVVVTFPGPQQSPRHEIVQSIYSW